MSLEQHQLEPPPAVLNDPQAFEILRVWAAHSQQHVTIHSGLNGGPEEFGLMLAQLGQHGAILIHQRDGLAIEQVLERIKIGFEQEWYQRNTGVTGNI